MNPKNYARTTPKTVPGDIKKDTGAKPSSFTAYITPEDTLIQTPWGEALIKAGHYIVTDNFGTKFGIPPADFEREFKTL